MRSGFLASFAVFSAAGMAYAQTVAPGGKAPTVRMSFIGEGGASPAPIGAELGGAFEEAARQQGRNQGLPRPAQPPKAENPNSNPVKPPSEDKPDSRASVRPSDPEPRREKRTEKEDGDRQRYSLWDDLEAPLELPQGKVGEMSADQAMTLGRQDYDAHILGQKKPQVPMGDSTDLAAAQTSNSAPGVGAPVKKGEIFVSFDLDLKSDPNQYRDALAGLGSVAQFQPDARFAPRFAGLSGQRVSVSGWMPADKISAAMQVPSVLRMQVERGAARPTREGTFSQMLVGIRIPKQAMGDQASGARQNLTRVVRELAADAGFVWKKTIGYQSVPGSSDLALVVAGEVAIKNLSRVMAHPDVIKLVPAPGAERISEARIAGKPLPPARRFFSYAMDRAPWLILLTLVVLVPSVGAGVIRLAKIFIPYG